MFNGRNLSAMDYIRAHGQFENFHEKNNGCGVGRVRQNIQARRVMMQFPELHADYGVKYFGYIEL